MRLICSLPNEGFSTISGKRSLLRAAQNIFRRPQATLSDRHAFYHSGQWIVVAYHHTIRYTGVGVAYCVDERKCFLLTTYRQQG